MLTRDEVEQYIKCWVHDDCKCVQCDITRQLRDTMRENARLRAVQDAVTNAREEFRQGNGMIGEFCGNLLDIILAAKPRETETTPPLDLAAIKSAVARVRTRPAIEDPDVTELVELNEALILLLESRGAM